jgi:hypothetical protein
MKRIIVAVLAIGLLVPTLGHMLRAQIRWPSTGPTCSAFLQSTGRDRDVLVSFMLGFFAGTNRERNGANQVMLVMNADQTEARTLGFCTAHPQRPMADAAFVFADEVKAR